jgi:murein tripeptide amidase MpaA
LRLRILNAGEASFGPGGFGDGYAAVATYDRHNWFRVTGDVGTTSYDAETGILTLEHTPTCDAVYYAYFAPFTLERHQKMIARTQAQEGVSLEMVGETLDGHDVDVCVVGPLDDPGRPRVWILARQHPGEPQGEYFCEGLLARLLDPADAVGRALREAAVFLVVPNMNPDGSWRGHLRTNAAGVNLNRAWAEPVDRENAPEVAMVKQAMRETGVDLCLDVHGDEAIPGVFAAGCEGVPGFVGGRLEGLQAEFIGALKRRCPEFTTDMGYGRTPPGKANPAICKNAVAAEFGALAMTLELPFKDCAYAPDPVTGWSPSRSYHLGRDVLGAIWEILPSLKKK